MENQISNKNKPTFAECNKWMNNKSVNPQNGRKINPNGRIAAVLDETCAKKQSKLQHKTKQVKPTQKAATVGQSDVKMISNKSKPTDDDCYKWLQHKSVNPRNERPINPTGRIAKVLKETCAKKPVAKKSRVTKPPTKKNI